MNFDTKIIWIFFLIFEVDGEELSFINISRLYLSKKKLLVIVRHIGLGIGCNFMIDNQLQLIDYRS